MKLVLCFIIVSMTFSSVSQNLIPNGSFENLDSCPVKAQQIYLAKGWYTPFFTSFTNYFSTDFFHECAPDTVFRGTNLSVSVPRNFLGYQKAYSGSAYAGFALYSGSVLINQDINYRENLSIRLRKALDTNKLYKMTFFFNLADSVAYALSKSSIGVYFSKDSARLQRSSPPKPLPFSPQGILIDNQPNAFLNDTANWTKLIYHFRAQGGEKFITIGNFNYDSTTSFINLLPRSTGVAYYYIDDVSLIRLYEKDLSIQAITTDSLCYFSDSRLQVEVQNNSPDTLNFTQTPLQLNLEIFVGGQLNQSLSQTLNHNNFNPMPGQPLLPDSSLFLPLSGIDFSALGQAHRIVAEVVFPGDEDSSNNILDTTLTSQMEVGNSTLSAAQVCSGDSVFLSNQNFLGRPLWEYSQNATNWDSLSVSPQSTHRPTQNTFYRFSVCNQLFSKIFEVQVPQPNLEPGVLQFCQAGIKELTAITNSPTQSVNWYANPTDSLPLHSGLSYSTAIQENTTFYLEAMIDSCLSERVALEVELGHCELQIPNVFSPNGDGLNDAFYYRQVGNQQLKTQIFNRWGKEVATWQGNLRWDGEDLKAGVYFYLVTEIESGKIHRGTVTLLR